MAGGAERLPIALVPEQGTVAPVRGSVIYHARQRLAANAVWVPIKIGLARLFPRAVVTALAAVWPLLVKSCLALCIALLLASATGPEGNPLAAGTKAGRARWHQEAGRSNGSETATAPAAMLVPPALVSERRTKRANPR